MLSAERGGGGGEEGIGRKGVLKKEKTSPFWLGPNFLFFIVFLGGRCFFQKVPPGQEGG